MTVPGKVPEEIITTGRKPRLSRAFVLVIAVVIVMICVFCATFYNVFDLNSWFSLEITPSLSPAVFETRGIQASTIPSSAAPLLPALTMTNTSMPVSTETSVPEAIPFENILNNCPDIAARLGTPKTGKANADPFVAYQEFEGAPLGKGIMIYRVNAEKSSAITALFPDGTWKTYPDEWREGMSPYSTELLPPENYYRPVHGFEFAWLEIQKNESAGQRMNWATTCEINGDSVVWSFNEGKLFQFVYFRHFTYFPDPSVCRSSDIVDHIGKTLAIFYSPGTDEDTGTWLDITSCKNP